MGLYATAGSQGGRQTIHLDAARDVDGLILNDGTEVTLPPHLTGQIVFAVRPGDAVTVRGLKARALPLIDAALVTNSATGVAVVDNWPADGPGRSATEQTITGRIVSQLHGQSLACGAEFGQGGFGGLRLLRTLRRITES